ncbi:hypothetical protein HN51_056390 [Arachis hypogaea]
MLFSNGDHDLFESDDRSYLSSGVLVLAGRSLLLFAVLGFDLKVREEEELKKMGSKSSWSMVALAIMALSVVAMLDGCMAQSFCNTSLPELFNCKPAVTPPNPSPPTPECCAVVAKADLKCLCGLKNSPLVPTLGIDLNLAFQLPAKSGKKPNSAIFFDPCLHIPPFPIHSQILLLYPPPIGYIGCTVQLMQNIVTDKVQFHGKAILLLDNGLYTDVSVIYDFPLQIHSSLMMWAFASNALSNIRVKRIPSVSSHTCAVSAECSDDESCSNASRDEGLECPICWESFNIVENVPYVLWCGHSLCKNCVLGLQWAVVTFPSQQIKIPFFISCPWCHLLSFRLIYNGNLKFPCKNYFLLWMVESMNGDRQRLVSTCMDSQPVWTPKSYILENQATNSNLIRASLCNYTGRQEPNIVGGRGRHRHPFSLNKSLDFFIHFTSKFPLVITFLLIAFFAVPCSAIILVLYLLVTILFAIPSFLVLYFACPMMHKLVRNITS